MDVDWQEKIEFWLKYLKRCINEEVTKQSKGKESDVPVDPGMYVPSRAVAECLNVKMLITCLVQGCPTFLTEGPSVQIPN